MPDWRTHREIRDKLEREGVIVIVERVLPQLGEVPREALTPLQREAVEAAGGPGRRRSRATRSWPRP